MSAYLVEGGNRLQGTARVHGAKNSVLPILAATILCPGESVVHNCPDLSDVRASIAILEHLGCRVERAGDTVTVDASALTGRDVPDALMREMRSSVIFLGAILARLGEAVMSFPGGCELGPRPIDLHLAAIRSLGAQVREQGGELHCSAAGGLAGCEITFSIPSVGAMENAMLCASGAEGVTVICNAAREPEIVDLQAFLRALGADVRGAGTSVITVRGKKPLHGGEHTVMPDRIVAATLLTAVAAAGGEAELLGTDYRQLSTVTAVLTEAGCRIRSGSDSIHICREAPLRGVRPIRTAPYPGFPTDAQAILMAALLRCRGAAVFEENLFSSRYRHVDELARMGADIRVSGRTAVVLGVERLHGAVVRCTDLRGGAALCAAALAAEGVTSISDITHIDRGYQSIEDDLAALGADIRRVEETASP